MIENKYPFHAVMDVRIHAVTMEEALRCAREMAASGEEHIIATANAEMVMIAQENMFPTVHLPKGFLPRPVRPGCNGSTHRPIPYLPARS